MSTESEALKKLQREYGYETQEEMARAIGISPSTLSRAMKEHSLSPRIHRKVSAFIVGNSHSIDMLNRAVASTGWQLTAEEHDEAIRQLTRQKEVLHGVPCLVNVVFIGREQESEELAERLLARGATPRLVILQGLPGVGKTTLAAQVVRQDQRILHCFQDGIYWLEVGGRGEESALAELGGYALGTEPQKGGGFAPALSRAWKKKKVLLVLDGVDERITLDSWAELITDGTLLVTSRRKDLAAPESLLSLPPMNEADARLLLTQDVAVNISEEEMSWLLDELAGLPLLLSIANRIAWYDKGFRLLVKELRPPTSLPADRQWDRAREVFRLSYDRLSQDAAALFRFLSGFPQPFDLEPVAHVLDWKKDRATQAFRELVQMGLIDADQEGRYRMHNALYRYAGELSLAQDQDSQCDWERRYAEWYRIATTDIWKTWQAGQEREALAQWQQQIQHIDWGFHLSAKLGQANWLLEYLGRTSAYLGLCGQSETLRRWQKALESFEYVEADQALLNLHLGNAYAIAGEMTTALPLLEAARESFGRAGSEELWIEATIILGGALIALGRYDEAAALTHGEAYPRIALALPVGDMLRVRAWSFFGDVRKALGYLMDAQYGYAHALLAMEGESAWKSRWVKSALYGALVEVQIEMGDYAVALKNAEKGMALAEEGGYDHFRGMLVLQAARALVRLEKVKEARPRLEIGRSLASHDSRLVQMMHIAEGEILWAEGNGKEAEKAFRLAVEGSQDVVTESGVWFIHADQLYKHGRVEEAAELWQAIREKSHQAQDWRSYLDATLEYGRYLCQKERQDEARPLLMEASRLALEQQAYPHAAEAFELLGMEEESAQYRQWAEDETALFEIPLQAAVEGKTEHAILPVQQDGELVCWIAPGLPESGEEPWNKGQIERREKAPVHSLARLRKRHGRRGGLSQ